MKDQEKMSVHFAENKSLVRKSFVLLENHIRQLWMLIWQAGRLLCLRLSVKHNLFRAQVFNNFLKRLYILLLKTPLTLAKR